MTPNRPLISLAPLPPRAAAVMALFTSQLMAVVPAGIAAAVLVGWAFDLAAIRSVIPGAVEMKANTAVGLLASGIALYILSEPAYGQLVRRLARVLGVFVAVLGLATLAEYLFGWHLGIDELFFLDTTNAFNPIPGRMSPYSTIAFVTTGAALATMQSRLPTWLPRALAAITFGIGMISLLGYVWNAAELTTDQLLPPVAVHTAFAFLLLAAGTYLTISPAPTSDADRTHKQASINTVVVRGMGVGLVLIILLGGLAYHSSISVADADDWVSHTHVVRRALLRVRADVADAELVHLSVLLLGGEAVTDQLDSALAALGQSQDELVRLVADHAAQSARADTLIKQTAAYFDALPRTAAYLEALPQTPRVSRLQEMFAGDFGGMASIRHQSDVMMRAEKDLLDQRIGEAGRDRRRTLVTLLLAVSFAVIGYLVVLRGFRAAVVARGQLEERLRLANIELEARVDERTKQLTQTEQRFENLFESAPDAMLIVGANSTITIANREAERMFGWSREEIFGQPIEKLLPVALGAGNVDLVAGYLSQPELTAPRVMGAGRTLVAQARDGSQFQVEISLSPMETEEGRVVMAAVRNVSERVTLEQQLQQSQKMEIIGHLAGGIAHDFNNLITIINSTAEMAAEDLEEQTPVWEDLMVIRKAGRRAAEVTKQLLAFSRKQILQPVPTDLSRLVDEMRPILARVTEPSVTLEMNLATALPPVVVDPGQIEQVILNLAVNSRDAMPNGGSLRIETSLAELDENYGRSHAGVMPGLHVCVTVSDTGVGMDLETRKRIFEPFYTTKEAGKGTGLGLSTAYGIIKQSDGDIWVYSEPGQGTSFKIFLPVAKDTDFPAPEDERPSQPASLGGETILVAEDEPELRTVVVRLLTAAGYRVLEAGSATDALATAAGHEGHIHLLLTDVMMPGGTGRDLANQLVPLRPTTRVLYMSGYTDAAIVDHGVLDPGVHFISKPFSNVDIKAKVREVLDC